MIADVDVTGEIAAALVARNEAAADRFRDAAPFIAETASEMAERFSNGGRILAVGYGAWSTDAQHVAVEFVHPVIVGKQALPAIDVSMLGHRGIAALLRPNDMLMAFGTDGAEVASLAEETARSGAMVIAPLSAAAGDTHPFLMQEWCEALYHTLWESVHVFLERRGRGQDSGASSFLYPFLGDSAANDDGVLDEVAQSILAKIGDDAVLRAAVARDQCGAIASAIALTDRSLAAGGTILALGNGGSATDANDFAFDCAAPPPGMLPLPALSLSSDAATITAIANDVGNELIFVRQLIAHGRAGDVVYAFSTSGGSRNVIAALLHARQAGMHTVALLGHDGGDIARLELADVSIVVPSDYIPRIQEVQASIYHIIRERLGQANADR